MRILSIRQPWAGLIVAGYKDIENRTWPTNYTGPLLIHASLKFDFSDEAIGALRRHPGALLWCSPVGGIIGVAQLVRCTIDHRSPWFTGPYGFVLEKPRVLHFIPWRGTLGPRKPPRALLSQLRAVPRSRAKR